MIPGVTASRQYPAAGWDISGISYDGFISLSNLGTTPAAWSWNPTEDTLYVLNGYFRTPGREVREFSISTPGDALTTVNTVVNTKDLTNPIAYKEYTDAMCFSANGSNLYVNERGNGNLHHWHLTNAWDITSGGTPTEYDISYTPSDVYRTDMRLSSDGQTLYIAGSNYIAPSYYGIIWFYSLTIPYAITSHTGPGGVYLGYLCNGMWFNSTGTQLITLQYNFVYPNHFGIVRLYDIPTPWNLYSIAYDAGSAPYYYRVATQTQTLGPLSDNNIQGVHINSNGSKLQILGAQQKYIYQWNL